MRKKTAQACPKVFPKACLKACLLAAAGLWLAACSADNQLKYPFGQAAEAPPAAPAPAMAGGEPPGTEANAMVASPEPLGVPALAEKGLLGSDPNDDLSQGKKYYRSGNFGLAEKYFRHAVELHPRDAEAWLGLAASYDRLRRFDLADRAYAQAISITGPTVEILNNQGYSYMLRGDYARARSTLLSARRRAPGNRFVENNLRLLDESMRLGKAVR
jgi:tetratricopeptide (TPR) repeat protein